MNIVHSELPFEVYAKTCSCQKKNKAKMITYLLVNSYHSLCLDKKEILLGQIQACERLLKYAMGEDDKKIIEKEITELKFVLDLLS